MKIIVIVPAFDEEQTISDVILDLRKHGYKDIVVINDGSIDKTELHAKKCKVRVLSHLVNRGLGAALGTGFEFARILNAEAVVTFDADGQMRAKDIEKLLRPIKSDFADVVVGNRMANFTKMPFDRLIISLLASVITYLMYGFWFADSQSGFRIFNKKALNLINIKTQRMEVSSEILKEVKRNELRFASVPVEPIYTEYSRGKNYDNKSNLNAISVGFKMLLRLFR